MLKEGIKKLFCVNNRRMIKTTTTLSEVKQKINDLKAKPVDVTLNLGRNKIVRFSGTLVGVYPALFTVSPFDKSFKGKTSYSYSEYMCGRVKVNELNKNKQA